MRRSWITPDIELIEGYYKIKEKAQDQLRRWLNKMISNNYDNNDATRLEQAAIVNRLITKKTFYIRISGSDIYIDGKLFPFGRWFLSVPMDFDKIDDSNKIYLRYRRPKPNETF